MFESVNGHTNGCINGCGLESHPLSSPRASGSGELMVALFRILTVTFYFSRKVFIKCEISRLII